MLKDADGNGTDMDLDLIIRDHSGKVLAVDVTVVGRARDVASRVADKRTPRGRLHALLGGATEAGNAQERGHRHASTPRRQQQQPQRGSRHGGRGRRECGGTRVSRIAAGGEQGAGRGERGTAELPVGNGQGVRRSMRRQQDQRNNTKKE